MKWTLKKFQDLSVQEFHDIVQLRLDIFVVEQDCVYLDLDGKDQIAYHLFYTTDQGQTVAYTRLFAPGDYYDEAAIGRVVVQKDFRNQRLGFELMTRSVQQVASLFHTKNIRIGAQTYLKKFYESLGFRSTGHEYLEDGIPHTHMLLISQ